MEWNEYCELSEKTEKKFPNGIKIPLDICEGLESKIVDIVMNDPIDGYKKQIIYKELDDDAFGVEFSEDQIEMLHAAIGNYTEAIEVLDAVWTWINTNDPITKIDKPNIGEEIGDHLWYFAIMARKLNLRLSDIMDVNIDKLKARYGDKFTSEKALNRDLDVERKLLE